MPEQSSVQSDLASPDPLLIAVVVTRNRRTELLRCLESLAAAEPCIPVIIVDNASSDGSAEVVARAHSMATVVRSDQNLGYAGGNNLGIRLALERGAGYVFLLNDDAFVDPHALGTLLDAAKRNPEAGLLGPCVLMLERPGLVLSRGGSVSHCGLPSHLGYGESVDTCCLEPSEVGFLSGCALLASRDLIQTVGLLDERFFAYHEDVDWCYRATNAGFRLLVIPAARVWHPDTGARDQHSPRVQYYMARNHLLFISKHHMGSKILLQVLVNYSRTLLSWTIKPQWRHKRRQREALARALIDFAHGRFGPAEGL